MHPHAPSFINTPCNQLREYQLLQWTANVNWLGISPAKLFQHGPATETVRGDKLLLMHSQGCSVLNSGTLAVALLEALEQPTICLPRLLARNASLQLFCFKCEADQ